MAAGRRGAGEPWRMVGAGDPWAGAACAEPWQCERASHQAWAGVWQVPYSSRGKAAIPVAGSCHQPQPPGPCEAKSFAHVSSRMRAAPRLLAGRQPPLGRRPSQRDGPAARRAAGQPVVPAGGAGPARTRCVSLRLLCAAHAPPLWTGRRPYCIPAGPRRGTQRQQIGKRRRRREEGRGRGGQAYQFECRGVAAWGGGVAARGSGALAGASRMLRGPPRCRQLVSTWSGRLGGESIWFAGARRLPSRASVQQRWPARGNEGAALPQAPPQAAAPCSAARPSAGGQHCAAPKPPGADRHRGGGERRSGFQSRALQR